MASVMGICGGLVGPKGGNVVKLLVFKAFVEGSKKQKVFYEIEQLAGKWAKK